MQGGLPPAPGLAGAVVEIGCDESGFSGSNMLDPASPVITHASVDLSVAEAAALLAELPSGWEEVKSGRFLRDPGARLEDLLTALRGRAYVRLVDKRSFLAARIVDLFLSEPSYGSLLADRRPAAVAPQELLAAFVAVVRVKRRHEPDRAAYERFLAAADGVLDLDRDRVWSVLTRMVDGDESIPPPLEPLLPALAATVRFWSAGRRQVLVVHDEQSALTAGRLRRLQEALRTPGVSPLAGLVTVDSRDDPRVQVADLLAGAARRSPDLPALSPLLAPAAAP